jgi:citronellol/citronellal dehydrogenase
MMEPIMDTTLRGKTLFVTGGSRGIGLAIAVMAAREGANVAIAAKTVEPHPKLPGTLQTAAAEVESAGGHALPLQCDIRDENAVATAVARAAEHFGGIDILINNASAISLTGTESTPVRRFDLMTAVNVRGTYVCSQACVPWLKRSAQAGRNPHVLTLSPPPSLDPRWFKDHVAYTIAKYGMSLCVLGMAEEFRGDGIAFNALWPRTLIATAALAMIPGGDRLIEGARKPEIVADAAREILHRPAASATGNFYIDEDVLREAGVTDFTRYAHHPGHPLAPDLFLDT